MLKRRWLFLTIAVLVLSLSWWLTQPTNYPGDRVESQEPVGNWEEPVVVAVQQAGPATVKIETVQDVVIDQFFFQHLDEREGVGSGVIFRKDGYILTNDHVVAEARDIVIRLADGRSFPGEVVGRDSLSDLAVLRIDASDLPVAAMGDSNELRVGQAVIAIGNPLGQDYSVTTGVVSALDRDLLIDPQANRFLEGMVQTDAAINPGNSGGPLLNQAGEVIGINTAIFQGAQGIGFAIPATTAELVADQIIEHGRPLRLGVLGGSLTPALVEAIQRQVPVELAVDRGAYITRVLDDTPAEAAGLQEGDIITSVNKQDIAGIRELRDEVQKTGFGGTLRVGFFRGAEQRNIDIALN